MLLGSQFPFFQERQPYRYQIFVSPPAGAINMYSTLQRVAQLENMLLVFFRQEEETPSILYVSSCTPC